MSKAWKQAILITVSVFLGLVILGFMWESLFPNADAKDSARPPTPKTAVAESKRTITVNPTPVRWTELQYESWISQGFLSDALLDLSYLFTFPRPTGAVWREEVGLKTFVILGIQQEARNIRPPLKYQEVHETYLEALDAYARAARSIDSWLDSVEADPSYANSTYSDKTLSRIAEDMETGASLLRLATSQVR